MNTHRIKFGSEWSKNRLYEVKLLRFTAKLSLFHGKALKRKKTDMFSVMKRELEEVQFTVLNTTPHEISPSIHRSSPTELSEMIPLRVEILMLLSQD